MRSATSSCSLSVACANSAHNAPLAGTRLSATRDRALLLIGFAGAFRRSELVALNADDIEETVEGLRVTIRRSKTDQEGHVRSLPFRAA